MKFVGISQRVEHVAGYEERRDCLDQRWSQLAATLGWIALPLPNSLSVEVQEHFEALGLEGLILSGGNSLSCVDPNATDAAPERDAFEHAAISAARARGIPIVGVCRGMQVLNVHFGGTITKCNGHVGTRHGLIVDESYTSLIDEPVNSFHGYGIAQDGLADDLIPIASDDNGMIECFRHRELAVTGIMWHPERERPFRPNDLDLFRKFML